MTDTPPPLTPATLHAQARELHALAERLTQRTAPILAHFLPCVELLLHDGLAAARTDDGPHGAPTASHPERAVLQRHQITGNREDIRDSIGVLAGLLERFTGELDGMEAVMFRTAGHPVTPGVPTAMRCKGEINPVCGNIASVHRDPATGRTITGQCDDCWHAGCQRCHAKPAEQHRKVCNACRMAERREDAA